MQTARRHSAAALRFFRKISLHGKPEMVTFDKSGLQRRGIDHT
ncbi:TPA: hypothetical protein JLU73_003092 [Escherichia coli]|nr:hypothetical protein [Escherichia coli]EKW2728922.1 hypothetical protein [Escherichia coli]EKW8277487.1 hypothetical protein [Escherichia coli]ELO3110175.1 hypothetical protein [Escherichia coli]ELO5136787.1 hypothetical protein [Escherichia coli]